MCKTVPITILTAIIAVAAGCSEKSSEVEKGDLHVTYRVGSGSSNCEDVGIAFVRIHIAISETEELLRETFPCSPAAQSVTFTDVEAGSYTISIKGLDSGNNAIYSGQGLLPVTVLADQTNGPVDVVLDQIRPAMEIFFGFNDVGGCDRFEVIDIMVRVYENGSSLIHDQTYDCLTQINDSLLIPDLSDTSTFDLRIRGMNDFGEGTYEYNQDGIVVAPGASTPISAEMTPCTGLCSAP